MSKYQKIKDNGGFHVLIPAAGKGLRAGSDIPKQYLAIGGKAILRHTVEKFMGIQGLKSIRVIINPDHEDLYKNAIGGLSISPFVAGAALRKQSVYNGLCSYGADEQDDVVLIHDAARPFVSVHSIQNILDAMEHSSCATLSCVATDTLVGDDYQPIDRNKTHSIQTPQSFVIGALKLAHEKYAADDTFTDDAGLMSAMGEKITLVPSSRDNFKITTYDDFVMAEKLMTPQTQTRIGFGYDVHAFDRAPATHIRLGGIDIPHTRKLLGHSDADVILHALTDALLGTIGDGDIGQIFPPSDNQWKNADSKIFVAEALRRVIAKGGEIVNVDVTLVAEEPKIGPHRLAMQNAIAQMLSLNPSRVGLKATTSEGLGFVGERRGIESKAVVSIEYPNGME